MTRRGFTLVETLIAGAIGFVALGILFALSTSLWRFQARADERHTPREEAHLAFLTLRQYLSDAVFYEISAGASKLEFRTAAAGAEVRLDRARLLFRAPGQASEQPLIGAHVKVFRAEVRRRGVVRLTLELERPSTGSALQALAPLKMVDEITMPCLAFRNPKNPWHCPVEKEL